MGKNTGNRTSAPNKSNSSLLAGVLIGILVGAGMVAGVALYLKKAPSPFVHKEPATANPPIEAAKPGRQTQPSTAASGVDSGKPRFEFYKVLTDKQSTTAVTPAKPAEKPKTATSKPASVFEPQLLQAGSFSNPDDAEKLKAKLAMLGVEASIQSASIPDKGVWYRVRLGPYKSAEELNHARDFLKQNGVDSTPMHVQ